MSADEKLHFVEWDILFWATLYVYVTYMYTL